MRIRVAAEQQLLVGRAAVIEGPSPKGSLIAVFEDDGETGWFYAVDTSREQDPIRDAVHVYDVAQVVHREVPSVVKVGWSLDSRKAILLINDYPHAIFDFELGRGFCRTGFPPGHDWSDEAMALFG
jgi:hypothetical protein